MMADLIDDIERWQAEGRRVALATVVRTWGSSPRPVGAHMAISSAGQMSGSVSGGCVEGAVAQLALQVLADGRPRRVEYGVADELAQSVGLACGGVIEVFVEPIEANPGG
jgi:xanthine dehydrogenase accessory factor